MFQETSKAGSDVRGTEGLTFLETGLAAKVRPRGSQGAAIALGPEARKAWERAGSLLFCASRSGKTTHHGPAQAPSQPLPRERVRPGHQPIARRARQERAIQREKVANSAAPAHVHSSHAAHRAAGTTACMPRTRPHRAGPCGLTLRAAFMFPRGVTLDLT